MMYLRSVSLKKLFSIGFLLSVAGICVATDAGTEYSVKNQTNPLNSGFYTGLGFGLSHFDPKMVGDTSHIVEDPNSAGGHLFLGAFLKPGVSVEFNAAELGTLEFDQGGNVEYRVFAASALAYPSKNGYRAGSFNYNPFVRLGARRYAIEADNINVIDEAETSLVFGVGMNVPVSKEIGLRFDAISYSKDAVVLQIGVMLQPWVKRKQGPLAVAKTQEAVRETDLQIAAALPVDSDNDLVSDVIDQCPNTLPRLMVENTGCPVYDGIVSGVNFETDSDKLTLNAQRVLSEVAKTLNQHPGSEVDIHAHTDSVGAVSYNQQLSELRAKAVLNFLSDSGVDRNRFTTAGYGEQSPIDTNGTPQGRANNRRVELFAYRPQ